MKITDDSLKPSRAYHKIDTFVVSENEWDTKEGLVSPRRMYCTYFGVPKGTSRDEATSNSKKNQAHSGIA